MGCQGGGPLATQLLDKCIGGHTKTDVGRPWAEEVANVGHRGEGALGRFSVSIVQKPFVFFLADERAAASGDLVGAARGWVGSPWPDAHCPGERKNYVLKVRRLV